ncbi:MAG: hypothetical protein EXR29_01670 [Betaproteobacteria bacterium]|nr:hypothetical protein [Betaproteobacteria bacterium]
MAMPTTDPAEIEKRIADLKSVETWLGMNLNMIKMAIHGLEVQKSALNTMRANAEAAGVAVNAFASFSRAAASDSALTPASDQAGTSDSRPAAHAGEPESINPILWPWAIVQGAAVSGATVAKPRDERSDNVAAPKARGGKNRKESK